VLETPSQSLPQTGCDEGCAAHRGFYMATPEKALLDTLYYRVNLPVADELALEGINRDTLDEMAKKIPASIFRKKTLILDTVQDKAV
jgi:hypothetical protein